MEQEKITINLGVVELGKIDVLVENGIFSNRSDFIRTAVRNNLAQYDNDIKEYAMPPFANTDKKSARLTWTVGISKISRNELLDLQTDGERTSITVVGMLLIADNITPELFRDTVKRVKVYGKLAASDEIKRAIEEME